MPRTPDYNAKKETFTVLLRTDQIAALKRLRRDTGDLPAQTIRKALDLYLFPATKGNR
jgi:hypothetical protein